ncbi:homeobox protein ceh-31-like [Pristis pectinata]|uniref:homeobox protein ceh-31-like n=1 Tax=Pristis pectinata TaxID=685728 RepID=UPI00223C95C9|nr:homeobox protein ceh-31-like [Pristis pectinata]
MCESSSGFEVPGHERSPILAASPTTTHLHLNGTSWGGPQGYKYSDSDFAPKSELFSTPIHAMDGLYLDYLATVGFPERNGNPSGNLATNPQSTESPDSSTKQPTDAESGAAEQGNRPAPRGRMRTVFSEEQKRRLMQRFHRQRYISPQERAELARALGLNCKQVKTWYQNRRMKLKRSQYSQNPASTWNRPNFNSVSSQNSQLANHPDPHFGSLRPENLMIPQAPSPGFSNQIPRSGMGHSSLGILQTPPVQDELQYFATSSSYPPTQENIPLAAVGFEPTPPKRLEPKSSALDRSATLPMKE